MSPTSTRQWRGFAFFGFPLVVILGMSPASAATYDYTGNDFTSTSSPYTSTDFISGYITFATPLPDSSSSLESFTPTDFSFSDGVQTISYANSHADPSFSSDTFEFTTNASGAIIGWNIQIWNGEFSALLQSQNSGTQDDEGISGDGFGFNNDNPGKFLPATVAATPLPTTLPLLFTGIGFLGLIGWRAKRMNIARSALGVSNC
jgi:hypothetical protein